MSPHGALSRFEMAAIRALRPELAPSPLADWAENHDAPLSLEAIDDAMALLALARADALARVGSPAAPCPGTAADVRCYEGPFPDAVRRAGPAVCQVIDTQGGMERPTGTGSLIIGPGVILTAAHVLPDMAPLTLKVRFGFERECDGTPSPGMREYPITEVLEAGTKGVDFALLQCGPDGAGHLPGDDFPHLELGDSDAVHKGAPLLCIQHPAGTPKRVSDGQLLAIRDWRIEYDNHTERQSSGSPVLDQEGRLVALHYRQNACVRTGVTLAALCRSSTKLCL